MENKELTPKEQLIKMISSCLEKHKEDKDVPGNPYYNKTSNNDEQEIFEQGELLEPEELEVDLTEVEGETDLTAIIYLCPVCDCSHSEYDNAKFCCQKQQ